jgi:cell division protein ZapA (FtsZ GTPase activity inhibitor)
MPVNDLRLKILGSSFTITADEDPEYLEEIFRRYSEAVETTKKTTGLTDPIKIAILTGFLLSDEIFRLKKHAAPSQPLRNGGETEEAERLAMDLIARIDEALENKP